MLEYAPTLATVNGSAPVLQAYLLGALDFETALAFQHRLVYQIGGDRQNAALLLCEHSPLITIGRQGSRSHIKVEPEELRARRWQVRWVNRGGGCLLHLPGQLAIYPVLPLEQFRLGIHEYLARLQEVVIAVLDDFSVHAQTRTDHPGVWANGRLIASVGVAVRDWVCYYGVALNINPDLELFKMVHCGAPGDGPMTSLARERRGPLRPALVRERLLEHFTRLFPCSRVSLFSDHPSLKREAPSDALAAYS